MNEHGPRPPGFQAGAVVRIPPDRVPEAIDVLCDAFHDYPVMRFILRDSGPDFERHHRALSGLFVTARALRGDPILVVEEEGRAVAAATITPPGDREMPPEFAERRDALWREIGPGAKERYERLGEVWKAFAIPEPQYHLNMIGVRRSHHGRGLARPLLDAVHEMSRVDPASIGVSLTTELPRNVTLYEHFGYRIVGHTRVDDALETWGFFRDDPA
ncbi:MAG: GNAT family N-acetyltransferase [Hyphomicrobiales bacterium]